MAVTPEKVQVSIVGGLDTKTDEKNVAGVSFLELENLKFTKTGSLTKRDGFTQLPTNIQGGGKIEAGAAITSFGGEMLQFDGTKLYTQIDAFNNWKPVGNYTNAVASEVPALSSGYPLAAADFYTNGTISAYIGITNANGLASNQATVTLVDAVDNKVISSFQFNAYGGPAAVYYKKLGVGFLNNRFYFFYRNLADTAFMFRYLDLANPYVIGPETLYSAGTEITVFSGMNKIYVGLLIGADADLGIIRPDFIINTPFNITTSSWSAPMCSEENLNLRMLINTTSGLLALLRQQEGIAPVHDAVVVLSPSTDYTAFCATELPIPAGSSFVSQSVIYVNVKSTNQDWAILRKLVTSTGTLSGSTTMLYGADIASRAVTNNGLACLLINKAYSPKFDSEFLMMDDGYNVNPYIVAQFGDRAAHKPHISNSNIPNSFSVGTFVYNIGIVLAGVQDIYSSLLTAPSNIVEFRADFSASTNYFDSTMSNNLHISGGVLKLYDGQTATEHGFLEIPPTAGTKLSAAGQYDAQGGWLPAAPTVAGTSDVGTYAFDTMTAGIYQHGTYYVSYLYVWRDRNGQVHRSPPAIPWKIDASIGVYPNNIRFKHCLRLPTITEKELIDIEVYRTAANGSVLYKITGNSIFSFSRIIITKAAMNGGFITLDDIADIENLAENLPLYTGSGELESNNAQSSKYITTFKNRIFLMDSDGTKVWYSKLNALGTPVEFNDNLYIDLDGRGGLGTSLAAMDSLLVIFKEKNIFALSGDGPNNLGQQSDYRQPELISSDVGCTEPNSIVLMPDGVMFKSFKGIYILSRKLEVAYIGAPVERYNSNKITSATLCEDTNEVRFTLDTGRVLVYDYFHKFWTSFTNIQAIDSVNHDGKYHYLRTDGKVCQETPGIFNDFGTFIRGYLKTAWLQFAGIQGYQRVYGFQLLGNYFSPHKLLVKFAYNYNPSQTSQAIIDATGVLGSSAYGEGLYGDGPYGGVFPLYAWEVPTKIQKCTSVQFSIEDVQDGVPGQSFSLSNIASEIGILPGLSRTRKTNKSGAS